MLKNQIANSNKVVIAMGQGSSFGQQSYGVPSSPKAPTLINDPSQFKSFNMQPQAQLAQAQIGSNIGNEQARDIANNARFGAGHSAGGARQLQDIQAQGVNQMSQVQQQMAEKSFNDQLSQQANANQFNLGNYQAQNQQYANQSANNQAEAQRRAAALQSAFGQYGQIAGLFGQQ